MKRKHERLSKELRESLAEIARLDYTAKQIRTHSLTEEQKHSLFPMYDTAFAQGWDTALKILRQYCRDMIEVEKQDIESTASCDKNNSRVYHQALGAVSSIQSVLSFIKL